MHLHTLRLDVPRSTNVFCDGCPAVFRLATREEALFVHMAGEHVLDIDNGPMFWNNGVVVVPVDFSLQEV